VRLVDDHRVPLPAEPRAGDLVEHIRVELQRGDDDLGCGVVQGIRELTGSRPSIFFTTPGVWSNWKMVRCNCRSSTTRSVITMTFVEHRLISSPNRFDSRCASHAIVFDLPETGRMLDQTVVPGPPFARVVHHSAARHATDEPREDPREVMRINLPGLLIRSLTNNR